MARKADKLEPMVRIARKCLVCEGSFILSHPNSPHLLCEDCRKILAEMIMERRNEQQKAGQ